MGYKMHRKASAILEGLYQLSLDLKHDYYGYYQQLLKNTLIKWDVDWDVNPFKAESCVLWVAQEQSVAKSAWDEVTQQAS